MIAIETRYHGATNTKPSSVTARTHDGHKIRLTWDTDVDAYDMHARAALALCHKLGWTPKGKHGGKHMHTLQGAGTRAGYVFAFIDEDYQIKITEAEACNTQ